MWLGSEVSISKEKFGFMWWRGTRDAIFALRMLSEKFRGDKQELQCVSADMEKVYDRLSTVDLRSVMWEWLEVCEGRWVTSVRCAPAMTDGFNVEMGFQWPALSPFLFAMVMSQLTYEVRQESSWTVFAGDVVLFVRALKNFLKRKGMKVRRSKTKYLCLNERDNGGTVRLQGKGRWVQTFN